MNVKLLNPFLDQFIPFFKDKLNSLLTHRNKTIAAIYLSTIGVIGIVTVSYLILRGKVTKKEGIVETEKKVKAVLKNNLPNNNKVEENKVEENKPNEVKKDDAIKAKSERKPCGSPEEINSYLEKHYLISDIPEKYRNAIMQEIAKHFSGKVINEDIDMLKKELSVPLFKFVNELTRDQMILTKTSLSIALENYADGIPVEQAQSTNEKL